MSVTAPVLKDPVGLARMREAGRVARRALDAALAAVRPGVTTQALDAVAEAVIRGSGATPEFKGYEGFPAATCVSVNEEVVHGIPGDRVLAEGDLVSIDVGARLEGFVGDNAATVAVGPRTDARSRRLLEATAASLRRAVAACRVGACLSDVAHAIESHARRAGFRVIRRYAGHGIGVRMHEEPEVRNYVDEETLASDLVLEPGLCLAIEPMLTAGCGEVRVGDDGWTVVTVDGARAAHWEDVVAVTTDGPVVLTRP